MCNKESIKTGWLSPTGEFIPCDSYAHIDTALNIYAKLKRIDNIDTIYISNPGAKLLDEGWCSISIASYFEHGFSFAAKRLTAEQVNFLKPYYEGDYGLPMTDSCKMDYEWYKEI